jgi:trans-aconitate methyltransferase
MSVANRQWDAEFKSGALDFMDAPDEQIRHAVMASLIESYGAGEVCDLGCGPGYLLAWLNPRFTTRYVGVDVSATAVARFPASPIPAEPVVASIEAFTPPQRPLGALVASEVLYMLRNPGRDLARIAGSVPAFGVLIVSLIRGRPGKENWAKGSALVRASLTEARWTEIERVTIETSRSGKGWDVSVHQVPMAR